MKALIITSLLLSVATANAQDCRSCARTSPTVAACKICVEKFDPGKYTPRDKDIWCGKNQPACYGKAKAR
jgi:hypothetical protein